MKNAHFPSSIRSLPVIRELALFEIMKKSHFLSLKILSVVFLPSLSDLDIVEVYYRTFHFPCCVRIFLSNLLCTLFNTNYFTSSCAEYSKPFFPSSGKINIVISTMWKTSWGWTGPSSDQTGTGLYFNNSTKLVHSLWLALNT